MSLAATSFVSVFGIGTLRSTQSYIHSFISEYLGTRLSCTLHPKVITEYMCVYPVIDD